MHPWGAGSGFGLKKNFKTLKLASQVRGKGHWGVIEGIENLFALPPAAAAFVQNPLNFGRVQAVLDAVPAAENVMVRDSSTLHNTGFSGAAAPYL